MIHFSIRRAANLCLSALIAISLLIASSQSANAKQPNIILVFIDDMGWGDFSSFGNTEASTPHIDRLAKEGIAFEQFYVNSPICSPSRVAISTGQYPQRWGITSYLARRDLNAGRGIRDWLGLEAPMLARILSQSGYATGHFGKWHMGGQRDVSEAPLITEYGFDESITNFEGLGARILPLKHVPGDKPPVQHNLGSETLGHGPVIWHDRAYVTEKFTEAAVAFAKVAASQDQPFYLNLWPDDVHTPMHPPLEKWGDGSKRHLYLKVLETMDEQLGVLFDLIHEDRNLRDNTIILVCSDNGPEVGFGSAGPLRGHKATLFEGGIRSSLIAWAPGLMKDASKGSRNTKSIFSAMDLVPSLLSIASIDSDAAFDGENLADTLLGRSNNSRSAPLFFRRPPDRENFRHYVGLPDLAVRDGKWKLFCDYDGANPELYDLGSDPSETENQASSRKSIVNRLTKKVLDWHASMPADNGPELGRIARAANP